MRRAMGGDAEEVSGDIEDGPETALNEERIAALQVREQFILTVTQNGYGKRSSSYEYRTSGRGGKGIIAIATNARNGQVTASFPVEEADEIMVVTDGGQLIRTNVTDIRIAGRSTQGVTILKTREGEKVVSVEHVPDIKDEEEGTDG